MTPLRRLLFCCVFVISVFAIAAASQAQGDQAAGGGNGNGNGNVKATTQPTPERETTDRLTVDQVQAKLNALADRTDLTPEQRDRLKSLYDETISNLNRAASARQRADQNEADRVAAPQMLDDVKARLQQLEQKQAQNKDGVKLTSSDGRDPKDLTLAEVRQELANAQAAALAAQNAKKDLETVRDERETRRKALPDLISEKTLALNKAVEDQKALQPVEGESEEILAARRMRRSSLVDALTAELEELRRQQLMIEQRSELLVRRLDEATLNANMAQRVADAWQKVVNDRQLAEAKQREEEAKQRAIEAAKLHPVVKEAADENRELAQERIDLAAKSEQLTTRQNEIAALRAQLETEFQPLTLQQKKEEDAAKAGEEPPEPPASFGLVLRKLRSRIPTLRPLEQELERTLRAMAQVQSEQIDVNSDRGQIVDDRDKEDLIDSMLQDRDVPAEDVELVRSELKSLLSERVELLRLLATSLSDQVTPLNNLAISLENYIKQIRGYSNYINERIFWVRSTESIRWADFSNAVDALKWLFSPDNWIDVGKTYYKDARDTPGLHILGWLVIILTLGWYRWLRRKLDELGEDVGRVATDRFTYTIDALILTIFLPLSFAVLPGLLGWRLMTVGESEFSRSIGTGLFNVGWFVYMAMFLYLLCDDEGLAAVHFRQRARPVALVRRHLRWFIPLLVPAAFVVGAFDVHSNQAWMDSLGRFAFMIAMVGFALALQRIFAPTGGLFDEFLKRNPNGWTSRLRYIWYPLIIAMPIGLAVAAGFGYLYTAIQIERRCVGTIIFGVLIWLAYSLATRWLLLVQKRVAVRQAEARKEAAAREAAAAAASETQGDGASPATAPTTSKPSSAGSESASATTSATTSAPSAGGFEIKLADVGMQTKRLLRALAFIAFLLGLYLIWKDTLPALGALDRIEIFLPKDKNPITLGRILSAVLIIVITIVAGQNLPGLLEITVLSRLPLAPSARYAFKAITRYVITIGGILIAFGTVGVAWSDVQWLIAAVTVGLGFGLQEIFANFVSGLIILFERPIRVGDTVTVGDVSGTVTRIQMRATTITDWDRKELIVPNKEFITGQLVNWSLSDPILRVRIPVGIAYGSDTRKAGAILMRIAREDPVILKEPEPQVLFLGFGDSALNFEVRVFIPSIEHFIAIKHHMHLMIDDAFREANIEIAFPQRDIHIRSIKDILPVRQEQGNE